MDVSDSVARRIYEKKAVIHRKGDDVPTDGEFCYRILSGVVQLELEASEGRLPTIVSLLEKNMFFGEEIVVGDPQWRYTAVARTEVALLRVPLEDPQALRELLVATTVRMHNFEMLHLLPTCAQKVAFIRRMHPHITQSTHIAQLGGMSREMVSRALKDGVS